jgi:hypothetical protein
VYWSFYALRRFCEDGLIALNKSCEEIHHLSDLDLLKLVGEINQGLFCCASDNLNEEKIFNLRKNGCFIKFWGVGTAGCSIPPLGIVYKISQLDDRKIAKLSGKNQEKSSMPGDINSRYLLDENGKIIGVLIYDEKIGLSSNSIAVDWYTKNEVEFSDYKISEATLMDVKEIDFSSVEKPSDNLCKSLLDFNNKENARILIDEGLWGVFEKLKNVSLSSEYSTGRE